MSFNQYTVCVAPQSHDSTNQYVQAALGGVVPGGLAVVVALAASHPWCALFALPIYAIASLIAYCQWWLYDRLLCLDGDQLVIGMLVSSEPPSEKTGFDSIDTDFSINLLPFPNPLGVTEAQVEASVPFGALVKEQSSIQGLGLPFTGQTATDQASGKVCAIMHAEFEGGGVQDTMTGAEVGIVLAYAALIACVAIPPPWGVIVGIILAILAFLAALFGALFGLGDTGSPTDVNPSLSTLHTNDPATQQGADLLAVIGTWVYDAGHNDQNVGWNEIHPIKFCSKVGTWDGQWHPDQIQPQIDRLQGMVGQASSPITKGQQQNPENQWTVHPLIDGCDPNQPLPKPPA
jgi:hypothetical protein